MATGIQRMLELYGKIGRMETDLLRQGWRQHKGKIRLVVPHCKPVAFIAQGLLEDVIARLQEQV